MNVNQVSLLFALLGFIALGIGAVSLGLLGARKAEAARPIVDLLLPLAFVIALTCTLGSLYYSNIANFRPCRLCWWQRIFMYPLTPLLGIGMLRRDPLVATYGLPLTLGGLGYSAYHSQLRWFPEQGSSCEAEAACTSVWVNTFGFVSIPFMAFCGFLGIAGLLLLQLRLRPHDPVTAPPQAEMSI